MKKSIRYSLLLTLILIFSLLMLAACGGNGKVEPSEKDKSSAASSEAEEVKYDFGGVKIVFADTWGKDLTPGKDLETDNLIEKIDQVKAKYKVDFDWIKVDPGPYWDHMASTIMSGEPYGDVMYSFPWMFTDWIKAGAIKEVGSLAQELGIDFNKGSWNKFIIDESTYGGEIYGFSKKANTIQSSLLYNKRLFMEAGLTDPNDLIAQGKKWDYATMQEYARQLTKTDSTGATVQWGLSTMDSHWLMTTFVICNDGRVIDYSQNPPQFVMDEPKSLTGLDYFDRMLNIDKTIYTRPAGGDWKITVDAFTNGKIGMFRMEEWVIEYVRDVMTENGTNEDYALTYFPMGPDATKFVDESYGGNAYFIPATIDDEKAKAALLVYNDLMELYNEESKEEHALQIAESLFADEVSCEVYVDLMAGDKIVSNGACRVGLRESMMEMVGYFLDNDGTPQSIVAENKPVFQGIINDSSYSKLLGD